MKRRDDAAFECLPGGELKTVEVPDGVSVQDAAELTVKRKRRKDCWKPPRVEKC